MNPRIGKGFPNQAVIRKAVINAIRVKTPSPPKTSIGARIFNHKGVFLAFSFKNSNNLFNTVDFNRITGQFESRITISDTKKLSIPHTISEKGTCIKIKASKKKF